MLLVSQPSLAFAPTCSLGVIGPAHGEPAARGPQARTTSRNRRHIGVIRRWPPPPPRPRQYRRPPRRVSLPHHRHRQIPHSRRPIRAPLGTGETTCAISRRRSSAIKYMMSRHANPRTTLLAAANSTGFVTGLPLVATRACQSQVARHALSSSAALTQGRFRQTHFAAAQRLR